MKHELDKLSKGSKDNVTKMIKLMVKIKVFNPTDDKKNTIIHSTFKEREFLIIRIK